MLTDVQELSAKRHLLQGRLGQGRQTMYWEAAPFLAVEDGKLLRQREELQKYRKNIQRLQEQLRYQESQDHAKRNAAAAAVTSEQQAHESEKRRREHSLHELLKLQQKNSAKAETVAQPN